MNQETKVIVNSGGRNCGPYTADQLRGCIEAGTIQENDFAWLDNGNQWISVTEALEALRPKAPPRAEQVIPAVPAYRAFRPYTGHVSKIQKIRKARILVNRGGQSFGPYNPEQLRECLKDGTILENDFAWLDGANQWISVAEALEQCRPPEGPKGTYEQVVGDPNVTGRRVTSRLQLTSKRSSLVRPLY